jgi:hypothetical protein
MRRHRTTALSPSFLGALASFVIAAFAVAVTAHASGTEQSAVPRLVFPLVAKTELWDNYRDPRPNGHHAGIDMENPWRA